MLLHHAKPKLTDITGKPAKHIMLNSLKEAIWPKDKEIQHLQLTIRLDRNICFEKKKKKKYGSKHPKTAFPTCPPLKNKKNNYIPKLPTLCPQPQITIYNETAPLLSHVSPHYNPHQSFKLICNTKEAASNHKESLSRVKAEFWHCQKNCHLPRMASLIASTY